MSKKKNEKRILTLEPSFENILVCNDRDSRPFIENFCYEAENITQERLGTLFGIMEISDESEEASYIVNYLISIIRKEYFSKPKRGAVESLEAALHKSNLALSKLAEHGNLAWLGKLNAIIAVIEKNNLHFSQAGRNYALLLRNNNLTDISEGLSEEDPEPHPLKTFVNVASGRLESDDRLIIASEVIFDIFSFEEIKKSALRFANGEFTQFIRTALSNEVSRAAVLIIKMKEEEVVETQVLPEIDNLNVFSQTAFSRAATQKPMEKPAEEESQEKAKQQSGHLYIKENENSSVEAGPSFNFFSSFQEKISVFVPSDKNNASLASPTRKIILTPILKKTTLAFFSFLKKTAILLGKTIRIIFIFLWKLLQIIYYKTKSAYENFKQKRSATQETYNTTQEIVPRKKIFQKIIPSFSFLINLLSRYTTRQKAIIASIFLVCFIFLPLSINKLWKNYEKKKEEARIAAIVPPAPIPLVDDKNVSRLEQLTTILETPNTKEILNLDNNFFAITEREIINLQNQERYAMPEDFGKVDLAFPMEDLKIILLFNKEKKSVLSFSPLVKKFQTNIFPLPDNASVITGKTYLTYLYLVDGNSNQIYRYPRAEGGFGEKTDWKKDETEIKNSTGMAINENLFLSNGKEIKKFFRGQKQDFSIEQTATPIQPQKLWTERDNENLYVLDSANSRIVKLDKEGKIIIQYYHSDISRAQDFTVSETNSNITFFTPTNILTFKLN